MRIATFVTFAVLMIGCGRSMDALERPALVRSIDRGLCGSTLAVDANRGLWSEGGCENGAITLQPHGQATTAQLERLRATFDALPSAATCGDPSRGVARFIDQRVSGDVVFAFCLVNDQVPSEAFEVNDAFEALGR